MNPNLVEKDEQSPFNNSHILIQGQSDNNHIFYSQYHKSNVNLLDNQLNNSIKALKEKLMEKDQVIFEYIRKEKELNKIITNLNQELLINKEQIYALKEENKKLKINNDYLQKLNIENEKISSYNLKSNNEIIKFNNEKNELINEINRLKFIIQSHEDTIKKTFEDINLKDKNINLLNNEINEKNNFIFKNDEIKNNLRSENKQIPSLKRKIFDLEQIIKEYQEEIINLQKNKELLIYQNKNLEQDLNVKTEEIKSENIKELNKTQMKLDNLSKEINEQKNTNSKLSEKYLILKNDYDMIVSKFLNDLGNFMIFLDSVGVGFNNENIFQIQTLDVSTPPIFEDKQLSENFSTKYEIINSNLRQLKEKLINLFNKGNNYHNKIKNETLNSLSEEKKEFDNEKQDLIKKNSGLNFEIKKYESIIEKINKDYESIKNDYLELKHNYEELSTKNEVIKKNYNNFIMEINNELRDFPYLISNEEENNINSNPFQKIIIQITSLINLCKELNNSLKEKNRINSNINRNKDDEIQILKSKINILNKTLNEKEQTLEQYKYNENNLVKINKQLEKSLFSLQNNFESNNFEEEQMNNNQNNQDIQEHDNNTYKESMCNDDTDRENKLKKILDSFDIKKKTDNYCNNFQTENILNYNYENQNND